MTSPHLYTRALIPYLKALKIHSVESDIMMKDLVAQALRQFLKLKEGGEKK
jgi:hypothetical protein